MHRYKRVLFRATLWAVLFGSIPALAEPASNSPGLQIQQQLERAPLIEGHFEQLRQLNGLQEPLRSNGLFVFWQGHGLYWQTSQPFFHGLSYKPNAVLNWSRPGQPTPLKGTAARAQQILGDALISLFTFNAEELEKHFETHWNMQENRWSVLLVPRLAAMGNHIQQIKVQGEQRVELIEFTDTKGQATQISLKNITLSNAPQQQQCLLFYRLDSGRCSDKG